MPKKQARLKRAKQKIRELLKRGTPGNLGKLSGQTLEIAQAVAPLESVKKHEVRSGDKKRKTITRMSARKEIQRRQGIYR